MAVEIKQVQTSKELMQFVRFANELYKENPYYCPVLEFDEINNFNRSKNPALDHCKFVNFLAFKDGKVVGRISGIINDIANEAWGQKRLRFGWFDFIDDLEVSAALLQAIVNWGKIHGMDELNGPLGFTDFDHQGLLVEGYEYSSPMACLYNYPYYKDHLEAFGLTKEIDWIEFRIYTPDEVPERMNRMAEIVMQRNGLKIVKVKNKRELIKRYGYTYLDVIDEAYQIIYNFQPLTEKQKKYYCEMYFGLINYDFLTLIVNREDEIVGVGVGMPDISDALRKCGGKLFPLGWYHINKALKTKQIDVFDLLLIAVRPDYQNKGVNSLFFYDQIKYFIKYGVKYSETTGILETNSKNQANWEYYKRDQHKRRRAFIKAI